MKNKKVVFLFTLTAICSLLSTVSFAEFFDQSHWSARSVGLGNAFTGLANDPGAIFFNPAGTGTLGFNQGMYNFLTPRIEGDKAKYYNAQSLALVFEPARRFTWGAAWANLKMKNNYQENTLILNFSGKLTSLVALSVKDLYLGLNLKGLFHTSNQAGKDLFDNLTSGGATKSALGADTGIFYKYKELLSFGLAILNVNRPEINVNDVSVRLPIESRIGAAYQIPSNQVFNLLRINRITPVFDIVRKGDKWQSHFGTEIGLMGNALALRGGVNSTEATTGISFGSLKTSKFSFAFNYSFVYGYDKDTLGRQHLISVNIISLPYKKTVQAELAAEKVSPYRLGPDDVLQIITRNHEEFSGKFVVDPYGKILIPTLGEIKVEDLNREELVKKLKDEISKYVEEPNVLVSIIQYRSRVVFILGEVSSPGKYPIEGDSVPLREAIAAAGFPTGLAATWRVYVIKPRTVRPTYEVVNLYDILYRGKLARNVMLTPGDVVYVPMTILGKLAKSMSYLLDPFFKARNVATPLSTPKPLIDETQVDN